MNIKRLFKFTALLLVLSIAAPVMKAETLTANFDTGLPEGWKTVGYLNIDSDRAKSGKGIWTSEKKEKTNYLLTTPIVGDISFWARTYNTKSAGYITFYEVNDDNTLGDKIVEFNTGNSSSSPIPFKQYTYKLEIGRRIAIDFYYACLDEFTYTEAEAAEGPSLSITGFASGSSYDFGGNPVSEGTEMTFVLNNTGSQDLTVSSISVTGDYTISDGSDITSIPANGKASLTVKTPAKDTSGVLTIVSNDAETPYTINLSSRYKVPMPIIGVSMTSIDFGKVTETVDQTVTVSNTGDADLIASVTSSDDSFTVDNTSLNVQPGGSVDLKVTFNYNTEAFGEHTGVVKITPESGTAVDINVTAFAKDPTLWEEDFEGGVIPAYWSTTGWTVKKSFTGSNGTYMAYAGISSSTLTLTTPRLYAKAGEELRFEVGTATDETDKLTVEYSHDLQSWKAMEGSPLTSGGEKVFTAPEDGYYYLKFNGKYGAVDNFSGFRLALKEHDLSLVNQNIPATGCQYSPYTAAITVKEMMGRQETACASLMINGVKVAESDDVIVDANTSKTISLTYTPTEAVQNVDAVIIVNYSNETLASAPVVISIAEAPTLDENEGMIIESATVPSLLLKYTPVNGWNTIAVPFALTPEFLEAIFGVGFEVYEFREFNGKDLVFREPTFFAAGYPYLVRAVEVPDSDQGIILHDVKIDTQNPGEDSFGGVAFSAAFSPLGTAEIDGCYSINTQMPVLIKTSELGAAPGFRGYVTLPAGAQGVPGLLIYTKDGVVTGLSDVLNDDTPSEVIYDMQGRVVSRPLTPGIYIIKGNKIIVR